MSGVAVYHERGSGAHNTKLRELAVRQERDGDWLLDVRKKLGELTDTARRVQIGVFPPPRIWRSLHAQPTGKIFLGARINSAARLDPLKCYGRDHRRGLSEARAVRRAVRSVWTLGPLSTPHVMTPRAVYKEARPVTGIWYPVLQT